VDIQAYRDWNNGLCRNVDMRLEQRRLADQLIAEHGSVEVL
jgi:hypothetical protein